jgi:hypothetical protein
MDHLKYSSLGLLIHSEIYVFRLSWRQNCMNSSRADSRVDWHGYQPEKSSFIQKCFQPVILNDWSTTQLALYVHRQFFIYTVHIRNLLTCPKTAAPYLGQLRKIRIESTQNWTLSQRWLPVWKLLRHTITIFMNFAWSTFFRVRITVRRHCETWVSCFTIFR